MENKSHLLQMRGLKQQQLKKTNGKEVASFTDAWIETQKADACLWERIWVASFTDAWIETFGKGYKQQYQTVASFTDAWIETTRIRNIPFPHLRRIFYRCVDWNCKYERINFDVRVASFTDAWIETILTLFFCSKIIVASFTDAWIETQLRSVGRDVENVASFTDAWIETFS